jgi:hypothetical protein
VFLNLIVNAAQAMPEGRVSDNEVRVATRPEAGLVVAERMPFMTGGAFSEEAESFLRARSTPTLNKPFKAADLHKVVAGL